MSPSPQPYPGNAVKLLIFMRTKTLDFSSPTCGRDACTETRY
jgi:hypothetical protein